MRDASVIADERQRVVAEAWSWVDARTPFHHCAAIKGVGIDCTNLLRSSFATIRPEMAPVKYLPQWHMNEGVDGEFHELLMEGLIERGLVEISDGLADVEPFDKGHFIEAEKGPGDIIVVRLARTYAHGAVIADWPQVIQAECAPYGRDMAVLASVEANWYFTARPVKFFSLADWH